MATLLAPPTNQLTYPPFQLWRITVERYHEMIEAGILTENDRLELLEGFLIEKMTIKPSHTFVTEILREILGRIIPDNFFVNNQQPITTSDSEPEPDVVVIQGQRRDFLENHPSAEDVALLIEVSDTTLYQDQTWKKRIYAQAGIAIYWIVNLSERQIEVYSQPSGPSDNPTYHQLITYHEAEQIPVILNGQEIAQLTVRDLLP
ncbi:MAG: Uma2 family endonuclease [Ardenticatenaceae bacterium]|nr:Uma2 family endonuclease [Ardenticatenaceae bacterium]